MATTGQNIKEARKLRGLSQRELSDSSGVPLVTIKSLEQGKSKTARMETLRKLAVALRTTTMKLADGGNEEGATPETVDRWKPVRDAIERPPVLLSADADPPTVAGVRKSLDDATPLFVDDRFSALSIVLPPLLRDAEALGSEGRAVRVRLLQLAGWLMVQTRQFDAAETALARALDDAADRMEGAATINTMCWLLLRRGELGKAYSLAVKWADETEPRISRATPAELSTWGWMLLRVSAAAVRNSQPGEAEDALKFATSAAVAMGREYAPENDFLRTFGPTTVKLKAAENMAIIDRPDMVLQLAKRVPFSKLKPTSNNRNRHLLDVSDALVKTGQYGEAVEKLWKIQEGSPEWLPSQRFARDIVEKIVTGRRTLTPEMRTLAGVVRYEL
ncbi:helix-turn-helix domain-containing protein [Streptomyces sp. NPDC056486]|uniref:helix-turn-helix domain-containing protein n=1 Tax=Streptomyces sp. NPDC056486 TaxID=3345835 RepID=UPI0036A927B4